MKYNSIEEFLPAWTAALRSGDYKQGINTLRDCNNNFCCLGVAYDLLVEDGQGSWIETASIYSGTAGEVKGMNIYILTDRLIPSWFRTWLITPVDEHDDMQAKLMWLNDVLKKSFTTIADFIEGQPQND
jgi:hypothetical protein